MIEPVVINFLEQPSHARLRREVQNIVDSYSHPWDPLAELLQNSVDAIRMHRKVHGSDGQPEHGIRVVIDKPERSIEVVDTGIGFDSARFAELLAPGGTTKTGSHDQVGEKGVGLTYTLFVANRYEVETRSTDARIRGRVLNGLQWRLAKTSELPNFEVVEQEEMSAKPHETGTRVVLGDVEHAMPEHEDLFAQSAEIISFLLRTKTAVGYLKNRLTGGAEDLDIKVTLVVREHDGPAKEVVVPFDFLWPDQLLGSSDSIALVEDFMSKASKMSDKEKAKELGGRALVKIGSMVRAGREIKFYAFFAPSRALWRDMSEKNALVRTDVAGEQEHLMHGGIFVGSRGMPTSIEVDHPATGFAGYWPNFFIFLEDDFITFDVGRKAIPGPTKWMLRDIAKSLFKDIQPYSIYATKDPATTAAPIAAVQQYEKSQTFSELAKLTNLGLNAVNYRKHPDGQEAAVVALFHELIGAGLLPHYKTLRTGYRETYDWWGKYQAPPSAIGVNQRAAFPDGVDMNIVIEHKFRAESILADLDNDVKFFTDMDLLVCWDIDAQKFKSHEVQVTPIPSADAFFYGSNYMLTWPGAYNLGTASQKPVMALRRLIEDLVVAQSASDEP